MKRKIIYRLLTILLIGGLYFGLRLGFGFFTPYNSLTARQDIKNGQVQIIAIGLPYIPQVRQRLAKQYGFEYNYVGCNATTELLNGSKYYNDFVEKYLTAKFGNDFWTKFNTQLDSIDNVNSADLTIDKVLELVAAQKIVKDQIKLIDSLSKNQRHISLLPTLDDTTQNIYLVKVGEDNGTNLMTYFNFLVDANSMTIINADGKLNGQRKEKLAVTSSRIEESTTKSQARRSNSTNKEKK